MKLRVKVESNGNTFNYKFEKPTDFVVAKVNLELRKIVDQCCKDSHFEEIGDVTLYTQDDW